MTENEKPKTLSVRVPAEMQGALKAAAKAEGRSVNNYIVRVLAEALASKDDSK